jgi:hypothetical protein
MESLTSATFILNGAIVCGGGPRRCQAISNIDFHLLNSSRTDISRVCEEICNLATSDYSNEISNFQAHLGNLLVNSIMSMIKGEIVNPVSGLAASFLYDVYKAQQAAAEKAKRLIKELNEKEEAEAKAKEEEEKKRSKKQDNNATPKSGKKAQSNVPASASASSTSGDAVTTKQADIAAKNSPQREELLTPHKTLEDGYASGYELRIHYDDHESLTGHVYVELVSPNGESEFFGQNPTHDRWPMDKGFVKSEGKRLYKAKENQAIVITKSMSIGKIGYEEALKYAQHLKSNPEFYIGHFGNDCVDFAQKIYEKTGSTGDFVDLYTAAELKTMGPVGASAMVRY